VSVCDELERPGREEGGETDSGAEPT